MAGLSDYLPAFMKQATGFGQASGPDNITCIEISPVSLSASQRLCILLGYERGFQVWDLSKVSQPVQILSKRTVAISSIKSIPGDYQGAVLLAHLYRSAEFPKDVLRVYSLAMNEYQSGLQCSGEVVTINTSARVICALTVCNVLDVFSAMSRERMYSVQLSKGEIPGTVVQWALSNLYLAYAVQTPREVEELGPDEGFTERITRSIYSLADQGYATVKSYIESSTASAFPATEGKVVVRHVLTRSGLCEIQAFPCPVSLLKFSGSSHFLVVVPESGQYFHVYRVNPPLANQKNGTCLRYTLLYKLIRGFTQAVITDISISCNEQWIAVTSSRGTAHVYRIEPDTSSLHYNHEVHTRVKHGWFTGTPSPKCNIVVSQKQVSRDRVRFEEPILVSEAPILVAVTMGGRYSTHALEAESIELSAGELTREAGFQEIESSIPTLSSSATPQWVPDLPIFNPGSGWLPLVRSPQIKNFSTQSSLEEFIIGEAKYEAVTERLSMPLQVVHYSSPGRRRSRILDSLESRIQTQVTEYRVDREFIDSS